VAPTAIPVTPAPVAQIKPPVDLVSLEDRPIPVRQLPRDRPAAAHAAPKTTRAQIAAAVRGVCAELLGYPPEVFEEDADLEADLGIDSIKRTQLELAILEHLKLPADTRDIMAGTFGELVATVAAAQEAQHGRAA
jgi:acyl carrier protein